MSYYNNDLLSLFHLCATSRSQWLMTIKINDWLSKESIVEYNNSNKKESNDNENDVLLDVRREMEKEKEMQIQESLTKNGVFLREFFPYCLSFENFLM